MTALNAETSSALSIKQNPEIDSAIKSVDFLPNKLLVDLVKPITVGSLIIRNQDNDILFQQNYSGLKRSVLEAFVDWAPSLDYTVVLDTENGLEEKKVRAPSDGPFPVSIRLEAPYGLSNGDMQYRAWDKFGRYSSAALEKRNISGLLHIRQHADEVIKYRGVIESSLEPTMDDEIDFPATRENESWKIPFEATLETSGADFVLPFKIMAPEKGEFIIQVNIEAAGRGFKRSYGRRVLLIVQSAEELAGMVEITNASMPTGRDGLHDPARQMDAIFFKPPLLKKAARLLGAGDGRLSYWHPYTYQAFDIVNSSSRRLDFLVRSLILYENREMTPAPFLPPDVNTGKLKDQSTVLHASVEAKSSSRVVLPIFLTSAPDPGRYVRKVSFTPVGSDRPLIELKRPLYVRTANYTALVFAAASAVLCLAGFLMFGLRLKSMFGKWKIRSFVIVALFGAVSFTVVTLPLRIFGTLISAMLGPLSVFATGFFNDLIYYSLLIALIRIIPRPGAAALSMMVRYLLGALMAGGFHVTDVLFTGTNIMVVEAALYLSGLTRLKENFDWSWLNTMKVAVGLALAGAFTNAASIYLHMLMFRLFFADWYIQLTILFNGVIYTMIGVMVGKRFSDTLIWVEE